MYICVCVCIHIHTPNPRRFQVLLEVLYRIRFAIVSFFLSHCMLSEFNSTSMFYDKF